MTIWLLWFCSLYSSPNCDFGAFNLGASVDPLDMETGKIRPHLALVVPEPDLCSVVVVSICPTAKQNPSWDNEVDIANEIQWWGQCLPRCATGDVGDQTEGRSEECFQCFSHVSPVVTRSWVDLEEYFYFYFYLCLLLLPLKYRPVENSKCYTYIVSIANHLPEEKVLINQGPEVLS